MAFWINKVSGRHYEIVEKETENHRIVGVRIAPRGGGFVSVQIPYEDFISRYREVDAAETTGNYVAANFGIDGPPFFKGWYDPHDPWNGWAKPIFTREVAVAVANKFCQNVTVTDAALSYVEEGSEETDTYEFRKETIGGVEYEVCSLGAGSWCWDAYEIAWDHTPTPDEVAERIKQEVKADVDRGRVPTTVASFGELHDYMDANMYGGAEQLYNELGLEKSSEILDPAQNKVDEWLRSGALAGAKDYTVTYAVTFKATIKVFPGEALSDKVANIDIPEGGKNESHYVPDTFNHTSVVDQDGNEVSVDA